MSRKPGNLLGMERFIASARALHPESCLEGTVCLLWKQSGHFLWNGCFTVKTGESNLDLELCVRLNGG